MKIVVIGGTGLIGKQLVNELHAQGHEAVPAAPSVGIDALTGKGLAEALKGASVVVDVSNSPSFADQPVLHFFETSTRNLLSAEAEAGVQHHLALSVVGTERLLESGYFRAKIAQEKLIQGGSIPYTIVRATQFFEFVDTIAAAATQGDQVRLSRALIQPIASDEVASTLASFALGEPKQGIVEIGGPERFPLDELMRSTLRAANDPRSVITDLQYSYFGASLHGEPLVTGAGATLGAKRFADWLEHPRPQA